MAFFYGEGRDEALKPLTFKRSFMSATTQKKAVLKGGEWLIKESSAFDTYTAENFTEEQRMIRDMCDQFLDAEVYPILDRIDNLEPGLMKSLLTKTGQQGLLAVAFPEEY